MISKIKIIKYSKPNLWLIIKIRSTIDLIYILLYIETKIIIYKNKFIFLWYNYLFILLNHFKKEKNIKINIFINNLE